MRPATRSRFPLPEAAARWVADVTGAELTRVTELPGGTSSLVCLLAFADATSLVLRLHTKDDWLAREPDLATREAHALRALADSPITAPALVAVDETGEFCGRPAVLMSRLAGRPDRSDCSPLRLAGLAAALRPLHRLPIPPALPSFRPYVTAAHHRVPAWTANPGGWQDAIVTCAMAAPSGPTCFVHRDYHPGNVLIEAGAITGIVDWADACAGPPEIDVAHCRINLAFVHGIEAADSFARLMGTDPRRQAYWDLVDCLDLVGATPTMQDDDWSFDSLTAVGAPPLTAATTRARLDEYVADALQRWRSG
jgi:aminoglycoside phosphotransferase (APT) family kinase protein